MGMRKEERLRQEGAKWMCGILMEHIEKKGTEEGLKAFWDEMKVRGVMNAPIGLTMGAILDFEDELKLTCKRTMAAMCCMVLHDEFGFSKVRLERFIERWNLKVDCLNGELCEWQDFAAVLKEECDVDVDIPICYRRNSE